MLLSLDGTLVVQLINFLVFLVVLNVIFLKPVGSAIAKRRAYINSVTSDIQQYGADITALHKQADERRAAARRDADGVMAQARAEAQARAQETTAQSSAHAASLVEDAHAQIEAEIAAARTNEERIVASLADDLLARALGVAA